MASERQKSFIKKSLTIAISLVFACLFLYLALRGINFEEFKNSLLQANYWWVLAAAFFGLLAYGLRAARWILLLEPMGYKISKQNSLWTISFGYLMNIFIPRFGEIARATALYGVERVPADKSFGTIILERIIDLICMFVFIIITALFEYKTLSSFYNAATKTISTKEKSNSNLLLIFGILFIVFFILIALFFIFKNKIEKLLIYKKIYKFAAKFVKGIFTGLKSIFALKEKWKFILYTAGIWFSYFCATYLVCFALPQTSHLTLADGCYLIVAGTLGMIVPAPAGTGSFHFAVKIAMAVLFTSMGLSWESGAEAGFTYAVISHTLQIIIMIAMGAVSVVMLGRNRKI